MHLINHFDLIAPYYDRLLSNNRSEKLDELVDLPINGSILDAGGGTGRVSVKFTDYAISIFVCDLSCAMLLQAKNKGKMNPVCSTTENMPYPNDYFCRIVMVDTLHHVFNQAKTINELWRVLAPGGRLIIEEPNIENWTVKLMALAEKLALMRSKFLSPREIQSLLNFKNSDTAVIDEGINSWVVATKSIN